jgi:PAS domain-containing protein
VPADREVRLEERLSRMTMLMTQSFAALPAGVALFDESGTLALFNPALSDLLGLDAAWLARRPDLRDLTDKLRSGRIRVGSDDILHWKRFQHLLESPGDGQSLTTVMPPSGGPGLKVTVKGLGGASRVLIFQEPGAEAARPGAAAPKASATA